MLKKIFKTTSFLLALFFIIQANVAFAAFADEYEYAETKVWGGTSSDFGQSVTVANTGEVYVAGYFYNTVDFDATSGVDEKTSIGGTDVFLTKYNADGSYSWTRTWGGTSDDSGKSVSVIGSEIYVTGNFTDTVDFDATGGVDEYTSVGSADIFLTKYNADGSYAWTRTWGGSGYDTVFSLAIGDGGIYTTGDFQNTVDFDATGSTDEYTSQGSYDAFLTKYNTDGSYAWTRTWGGSGYDTGQGVSATDSVVYVTGIFSDTVDLDATVGVDEYTSLGSADMYLAKYNSDGSYAWTRTWGGASSELSNSVVASNNEVYVTGYFLDTVDFDATGGADEHTSHGSYDAFLAKYNDDGSYVWTRTWGGTAEDYANSVAIDDGAVFVLGSFQDTVDFDATGGVDEHIATGYYGSFLSKYNDDGSYVWTINWLEAEFGGG